MSHAKGMSSEDKYNSIIEQKCSSCYKKDWCMLSPCQKAEECLGPFKNVEDNGKKFRDFWEAENKKPKVRINKAVQGAMVDIYRRMKREFDDWEIKKKAD